MNREDHMVNFPENYLGFYVTHMKGLKTIWMSDELLQDDNEFLKRFSYSLPLLTLHWCSYPHQRIAQG